MLFAASAWVELLHCAAFGADPARKISSYSNLEALSWQQLSRHDVPVVGSVLAFSWSGQVGFLPLG